MFSPHVIKLSTIPTIKNGLPPTSRIFTHSFSESVWNFLREPIEGDYRETNFGHGATSISVSRSSHLYSTSLSVEASGTIQTMLTGIESRLDFSSATSMIERVLPQHQALLMGEFGHRGSVVLAGDISITATSSSVIGIPRLSALGSAL